MSSHQIRSASLNPIRRFAARLAVASLPRIGRYRAHLGSWYDWIVDRRCGKEFTPECSAFANGRFMLLQLSRLASFVVAAVSLSGCFTSDYDISNRLKPDFPLAAGRYKSKVSKVISIAVSDDAYKAVEPSKDAERKISLRFFRVPEFDKHIVQAWRETDNGKRPTYTYIYAEVTANQVAFLDCSYGNLPPDLKNLVEQKKGVFSFEVTVGDGPRDTLYVIREAGHRCIKLGALATYRRQ
jgi:hypothetical protein